MKFSELELFCAVEKEEFVPYFQPLVDLRSGKVDGFEILARWMHPEHGLVMPGDFIQSLETRGMMNGLTVSLLKKAFAATNLLPDTVGLSVNISPLQLIDPTLPDMLYGLAHEASFDLRRLTVEITESALFNDLELANKIANELKLLGMRLSLDDFGTGYSSLLHLQAVPFDEIKVDASFVRSMSTNRQSRKIAASVVGLGESLGLRVVGEGVEELIQAEMLIWQGCDLGQGWLFGRPMPADYLPSFMEQQRPAVSTELISEPPIAVRSIARSLEAHPAERLPQLRAIYDGVPVGLAFLDRQLRFVNVNQRLAEMNGLAVEAHLGRKLSEVLPETYVVVESFLKRALAGEAIQGVIIKRPPAKPGAPPIDILASYSPAQDEAGEVIGVSVAIVDISITLPFMRSARQSSTGTQARRLFPTLPWTIDTQDVLNRASTAFQKLSNAYRT